MFHSTFFPIQCRCLNVQDTHCNTLKHSATPCATPYNTMQHPENTTQFHGLNVQVTHCNTLQHPATPCITLQHSATPCNTLHYPATPCNTLQHPANTNQFHGLNVQVALCKKISVGSLCAGEACVELVLHWAPVAV